MKSVRSSAEKREEKFMSRKIMYMNFYSGTAVARKKN